LPDAAETTADESGATLQVDDNQVADSAPLGIAAIAAIAAVGGCLVLSGLIALIVCLVRRRRSSDVALDATIRRASAVNADDPAPAFMTITPSSGIYGSAPPIIGTAFGGEYGEAPPLAASGNAPPMTMAAEGVYGVAPPIYDMPPPEIQGVSDIDSE
jgi:hypothetical protein